MKGISREHAEKSRRDADASRTSALFAENAEWPLRHLRQTFKFDLRIHSQLNSMRVMQDAPKPLGLFQTIRWVFTAFIGCMVVGYLVSVAQTIEDGLPLISHPWLWTADAFVAHARYAAIPSLVVALAYIVIRRNPSPNPSAPISLWQLCNKLRMRLIIWSVVFSGVFLVERIPQLRIQFALEQWAAAAWSLVGCLLKGPGFVFGLLVIAWLLERHLYTVRDK